MKEANSNIVWDQSFEEEILKFKSDGEFIFALTQRKLETGDHLYLKLLLKNVLKEIKYMILPMSIQLSEVEILKIEHNIHLNEVSANVLLISSQSFLIHSFHK